MGVAATKEIVRFENLVARGDEDTVPSPYAGFSWSEWGVLDRALYAGDPDGYENVVHGRGVAFAESKAVFSSTTDFTLKTAYIAAAWNTGLHVKFVAYDDGARVGAQEFLLDQTANKITFDDIFNHVDKVVVKTHGGTDQNPSDVGFGEHIALDNLKVVFDGAIPTDAAVASDYAAVAAAELASSHFFHSTVLHDAGHSVFF